MRWNMNRWMNRKKAVVGVFLGMAVAVPSYTGYTTNTIPIEEPTIDAQLQEDYNQAKEDLGAMTNELENTKKLLEDLKKQELDMQSYVQQLDSSMTEIANRINELNGQIEQKEAEITAAQSRLEEAEEQEKEQYAQMKLRIQYMYEQGESDYLSILLEATSFPDILNRMEYISKLVEYDRKMLVEYNETVQTVKNTKETLDREKEELVALKEKEEENQASQQLLMEAKKQELLTLQANVETQQNQVLAIEDSVGEQQQLTSDLEQELQQQAEDAKKIADQLAAQAMKELQERMAEEQRQESIRQESILQESIKESARQESIAQSSIAQSIADAQAAAENGQENSQTQPQTTVPQTTQPQTTQPQVTQPTTSANNQIVVENGLVTKLNLKWPVPSSRRITSHFGPRPNKPVAGANPFHHGTDIGAKMGADIVAAADGIVMYVGDGYDIGNQGCGNQIWIANGKGEIITMYSHCSVIKVKKGQYVKAGEVVGLIGSTGYSTGPHLDFRIYITGEYARYDKSGEYLDVLTGEYISPSDASGTRRPSVSISYY